MKSATRTILIRSYLGKLSTTIDLMISTRENAQEILENLNVVPVLTAHPNSGSA